MGISTHILDTARGKPAAGVGVVLEKKVGDWLPIASLQTNADGRAKLAEQVEVGEYRITFAVQTEFYPQVVITFVVKNAEEHFHVPLLLSPFGYSTYRGS